MKTIDQIVSSFKDISQNVAAVALPYLKELEGSTKQRIHNLGKDSEGDTIGIKSKRSGKYSPGYEKRKGKIVGNGNLYPINLQLKGDLFRSFTVGLSQGKYVLRFQDDKNAAKAGYAEANYKVDIYRPSDNQLEDSTEVLTDAMKDFLIESFRG